MAERGPGLNFTDRQRIKRKAARWAAKFAALPPLERAAVLEAVLAAGEPHQNQIAFPVNIDESVYAESGHGFYEHHEDDGCLGMMSNGCWCDCLYFSPMPGLGATKPVPRESAEPGGHRC